VDGGQRPVTGLYEAVERASACPPGTGAAAGFYGFERRSHRPLHGGVPFATAAAARRAGGGAAETVVVRVPRGIAVLRSDDLRPPGQRRGPYNVGWVVRDDVALSGRAIRQPEQNFDSGAGGLPIVTMEFSAKGRAAFSRLTRAVARRGAEHAVPGEDPVAGSHHFAMRLDDEILSKPYINFRENPEGIDGTTGAQIAGGFTLQGARDLATMLALPPLPVRIHVAASKPLP
jgi:SecD/SecF fusion protein